MASDKPDRWSEDDDDDDDDDSSESEYSDLDVYEDWGRSVNATNILNAEEAKAAGIKIMTEEELKSVGPNQWETVMKKEKVKVGSSNATDDLDGNTDAGFLLEEKEVDTAHFMAVRPYKGALVPPSDAELARNNPKPPSKQLVLDWIYGYRAYDSRSNLVYNSKGHMVYPMAAVAVVYDSVNHIQRHFQGQTDDIICLAQHPANRDIIATGQVATIVDKRATAPHICIWDANTLETIVVLKNAGKRAVRCLAFSADGKYLASVADDDDHELSVWDWQKGKKLSTAKGSKSKILAVAWNMDPHNMGEICCVGASKFIRFWDFNGVLGKHKDGSLSQTPKQTFTDVVYNTKGYTLVAGEKGSICAFNKKVCKKEFPLHKGSIYSMATFDRGMVTGGKDGKVHVLSKKLTMTNTIECPGRVRSVHVQGDNLLVGLSTGQIYEVRNFETANKCPAVPVVTGHFDGELWALDVSPNSINFASAGEDNTVAVWDVRTHRQTIVNKISKLQAKGGRVKRLKLSKAASTTKHPPHQCVRGMDYSPDGKFIAVGTNSGWLIVYDVDDKLNSVCEMDLNSYGKRQVTNQLENWIQCIRYSPNGKLLAVGTHGSVIVLLDVMKGYKYITKLSNNVSAITHLDWSSNSKHIRCNDMSYFLTFYNIHSKHPKKSKQETSATKLRDVEWDTRNCPLSWGADSVFDPSMDGTDINFVDVTPNRKLLVAGDDFGQVSLFRYPVLETTNERRVYRGHSSFVQNVRFTPDMKYVVSAGGNDKAIIQWRVENAD